MTAASSIVKVTTETTATHCVDGCGCGTNWCPSYTARTTV